MGSKYDNCALFVDANTPPRYCCEEFFIRLNGGECAVISMANLTGVSVLHYPTGDTDDTSVVLQELADPVTVIDGPGVFTFDLDCEQYDGLVAPTDVEAQSVLCVAYFDKGDDFLVIQAIQELCAKLELSLEPTQLLELIELVMSLCSKMETSITNQESILEQLLAFCEKILNTNDTLEGLCEKLEKMIEQQNTLIVNQAEFQAVVVDCLKTMKDKLCVLVGDPDAPCPECDPPPLTTVCDVKWFMTYAQATFAITGLTIPGVETDSKFTFPINGNSLPALQNFQETVVQCLEANGYTVQVQQGRDGWTIAYNGPCPEVITSGQGSIQPQCENCTPV